MEENLTCTVTQSNKLNYLIEEPQRKVEVFLLCMHNIFCIFRRLKPRQNAN